MEQRRDQRSAGVSVHRIGGRHRVALTVAGLASWLAGGAASFLASNGPGSAALIVVGGICGMLGLMGRWPSRISVTGNEVTWETIDQAVSTQIQVAVENDESETVLAELTSLRDRLAELQRTGTVPKHPAQVYDEDVVAAIRRLLPGSNVFRHEARNRATPDYLIQHRGSTLFVETKWRAETARPFGGSTLPLLTAGLPPDAKLLVITNTKVPPLPAAHETLRQDLGDRGRIVRWLDATDDGALAEALTSVLTGAPVRNGEAPVTERS
ncbi:MAG: hypothetical protein ABSA53_04500 [Streptosporangiaceae bacterium]